jgi:dephospho-CoA kinase
VLNVALTGNIAAGKSTVVDWFRRWGATVVDADALARDAQAPGSDVLATIVRRFGTDVLAKDGTLDRAALRGKVMGDDDALSALNSIVHPAVQSRRLELQDAARRRGDVLLVNDIPLLFEVLDPAQFDAIVVVDAPVALRRTRLRTKRGLSNEEADRMIAAQMDAGRKRAQAQYVIDNDGSLDALEAHAHDVFVELRRRAAGTASGTVLLLATDAKDDARTLGAIAARCGDAGATVDRVTGKGAALAKALRAAHPAITIATDAASSAARTAWLDAGRPGKLLYLADDPDPIAVRLDLRPWGKGPGPIPLSEEGGTGLAPRADVW